MKSICCVLLFLYISITIGFSKELTFRAGGLEYQCIDSVSLQVSVGAAEKLSESNLVIPSRVGYQGVWYDVVAITDSGFANHAYLEQIQLPTQLVHVGVCAFRGCQISQPLYLPLSVRSLGPGAFQSCNVRLNSTHPYFLQEEGLLMSQDGKLLYHASPALRGHVQISEEVDTITPYAFEGVKALVSIFLPRQIRRIPAYCFKGCEDLANVVLPVNLEGICGHAFEGCTSLYTLKLPKGVKHVGEFAFAACRLMEYLPLPLSVDSLGRGVFEGAGSLKVMTLPRGVKCVPSLAFKDCFALRKVELGDEVVSLGDSVFQGCESLIDMTLPVNIHRIPVSAFEGCYSLRRMKLSPPVTSLEVRSFAHCRSLEELWIPASLKHIGDDAFLGAESLPRLFLPDEFESMGSRALKDCKQLNAIIFGKGSQQVGDEAMQGCPALKFLSINGTDITWGKDCFDPEVEVDVFATTLPDSLRQMEGVDSIGEDGVCEYPLLLSDDFPFRAPVSFTATQGIYYDRTIQGDGEWHTLMLPFDCEAPPNAHSFQWAQYIAHDEEHITFRYLDDLSFIRAHAYYLFRYVGDLPSMDRHTLQFYADEPVQYLPISEKANDLFYSITQYCATEEYYSLHMSDFTWEFSPNVKKPDLQPFAYVLNPSKAADLPSKVKITIDEQTGLTGLLEYPWSIYLMDQQLYVSTQKPMSVIVYDLTGKLVLQCEVGQGETMLNLPNRGVYVINGKKVLF